MTKNERNRVLAWQLKVLREARAVPRNVAPTCRHFGLSRKAFYKWKARYEAHGEAGLTNFPSRFTNPRAQSWSTSNVYGFRRSSNERKFGCCWDPATMGVNRRRSLTRILA